MYVTPEALSRMVVESQASGKMTEELAQAVRKIGIGYASRYKSYCDADDAIQDSYVTILRILPRLDPSRNLFAYLTQIVASYLHKQHRADAHYEMKLASYSRKVRARRT